MDFMPWEDFDLLYARYPFTVELYYLVLRDSHARRPKAVQRLFEAIQKVAHPEIKRLKKKEA